jgi:hypothetical protein
VAALSPPAVGDVLAGRSFRLVSSDAFSQPPNDPTTRLEQLCARLAGASFGAPEHWSETVFRQAHLSRPNPVHLEPHPARRASPRALYGSCSPPQKDLP